MSAPEAAVSPDALLVFALARSEGTRGALSRLLRRWREEQGRGVAELFERPEEELRALLFPPERAMVAQARASLAEARAALAVVEAEGIRALCRYDEEYPHTLRENLTLGALPLLFLRGDARILRLPGIAVVGSRDARAPEMEFARALARRLAAAGCNIVSGHARGIDQAAYEGAIEQGRTTIVLPQGLRPFLADWPRVDRAITTGRVLALCQFLPDAPWASQQAIARNVTIHALSVALVIVAAGTKEGTWFTARDALRRGRPVFVRRPPAGDLASPGNAQLIEEGALPLADDAEAAAAEILLRCGVPCAR